MANRMTNLEIVTMASEDIGFEYDGDNLKTFSEWKKVGKSVMKGEKALLTVELWKPVTKKEKNEKSGEDEEKKFFYLKKCHLFSDEQVQDERKPVKKSPKKSKGASATPKKKREKYVHPVKDRSLDDVEKLLADVAEIESDTEQLALFNF